MSVMIGPMFDPQLLASTLAGIAAFCTVLAALVPVDPDKRLKKRLHAVTREGGKLRKKRLEELGTQKKAGIRRTDTGIFGKIMTRLNPDQERLGGDHVMRLRMAGFRGRRGEAVFVICRITAPIFFGLTAFLGLAFLHPQMLATSSGMCLVVAAAASGYALPRLILDRLIAHRQRAILRAFPDALDLLLICVQSGLSVEAALGRVTKDIAVQSIELAEELSLTMAELSYLPIRWRAYSNLGERIGLPSVKLITGALVQAERHGTSISQALNSAALAGREARIAEAEYKAAALPAKLSIPLVIFFLPVLLSIILAPALMESGRVLKKHSQELIEQTRTSEPMTHRQDAPASRH